MPEETDQEFLLRMAGEVNSECWGTPEQEADQARIKSIASKLAAQEDEDDANLVHFRKGLLWITWCGEVPDQCDARIDHDLDKVTCKTCKHERDVMGNSPDVLERAECYDYVGHSGHLFCGFCPEHLEPRILCKCRGPLLVSNHDPKE